MSSVFDKLIRNPITLFRVYKRLIKDFVISPRIIFKLKYTLNLWGSPESKSGRGSELKATETMRPALQKFIHMRSVQSILDAPCGDCNWIMSVIANEIVYCGVDIVEALVIENRRAHGGLNRTFCVGDICDQVYKRHDLIICRDCFVHLSFSRAQRALDAFIKSGSTYLAITSFPSVRKNQDIVTGAWRPLNMALEPFALIESVCDIDETVEGRPDTEGKFLRIFRINN